MTYSNISKKVGWEEQSCSVPSNEELDSIIEKAENGCVDSFRKILTINRFSESTSENIDRINKNYTAYIKLKNNF